MRGIPAFSTLQALDVWADLEWMYWNGTSAKIYAFRLVPHNPTFAQSLTTSMGRDAEAEVGMQATFGFMALLDAFMDKRTDAIVNVDGDVYRPRATLLGPETHRWNVSIGRRSKEFSGG